MHFVTFFLLTFSANPATPVAAKSDPGIVISDPANSSRSGITELDLLNFEDSVLCLYNSIGLSDYHLSFEVFRYSMIGFYALKQEGRLREKNLLSIIDFSKPSCEKRFYTVDLDNRTVKYYTYVSHGKNTGENFATSFSNTVHSNQSSLGFYVTAETYVGSKGYSLKLDGTEKGFNDRLRERAVVMHEAEYVSEAWIKKYGRLGRSQGCPALPHEISREVIDNIKNRTAVFAYYGDHNYLQASRYLSLDLLLQKFSTKTDSVNSQPPVNLAAELE